MLRRRLTWFLAVLTALVLTLGGALSSLALFAPFAPGDALFPLQRWTEQVRLTLIADPIALAERRLDLVELRLMDLEYRLGTEHELTALSALDDALNQAIPAVEATPPDAHQRLQTRLALLAARLSSILRRLSVVPQAQPDIYASMLAKAEALFARARGSSNASADLASADLSGMAPPEAGPTETPTPTPVVIAAHPIPFPPNATPGPHDFFPLTGRHAALACSDCHARGAYRGTARQCAECHADVTPADHYPGACDSCHSTAAWMPATFDHTGFADCQSCHLVNKPANHYDGQCSQCHSTAAWIPATFNHAGFTDCQSCHLSKKPANHYEGQCLLCHSTSAWKPATFNHTVINGADCQLCHANRAPVNHWPAPCTRCHVDTGNWRNVRFDHSVIGATDCAACHASRAPANHYGGACSACHRDTGNWRNATFDHGTIGSTDCAACHASRAPANHFPAPCRNCHTDTGNWKNVNFSHAFPLDHHGANGNCSTCHPGNDYGNWTCTACHAQNKMDDKHKEISGYTSNCLVCHPDGRKHDD
jgi:hypothetical protein